MAIDPADTGGAGEGERLQAMANEAPHFHDCPWGTGGKHICFDRACAKLADEPPTKGAPFHG